MQTSEQQPDLSFVHLSDPHLTSLEAVRWQQLVSKRLLGYLSWVRKRRAELRSEVLQALTRDLKNQDYDHLVITGDLTHISLPEEFIQARQWLDSLGEPGKVSVVPGNHDAYVRISAAQGLGQWAPYTASDADIPAAPDGDDGDFPSLRIRGPVAFIGLSSAVPTLPLLATGKLGRRQLKRFEALLQWTQAQGYCRVVSIHHPPVPGLEKWRKRLIDAEQVAAIIDRQGAELVLHGHCHRPVENWLSYASKPQIPVIGAPSALSIHPDPDRVARYYLYRVHALQGYWRLDVTAHAYIHADDAFQLVQEMTFKLPRETASLG